MTTEQDKEHPSGERKRMSEQASIEEQVGEVGRAYELLGEYGAGGAPAGLVGGIHNLAHRAEAAEDRAERAEAARDLLLTALQPFALAGEAKVRRPVNHPLLPDSFWANAVKAYRTVSAPPSPSQEANK